VAVPLTAGMWRNHDARNILLSYGLRILPTYNMTVPMSAFHRPHHDGNGQECTHYCHPSAPHLEVVQLIKALREAKLSPPASPPRTEQWGIPIGTQAEDWEPWKARKRRRPQSGPGGQGGKGFSKGGPGGPRNMPGSGGGGPRGQGRKKRGARTRA
jgi:hypothetical protein